MNDLKFNWIGEGMHYGQDTHFFCLRAFNIDLVYSINKRTKMSDGEESFLINRETQKSIGSINKNRTVDETINSVFLIKTDDAFHKKFKHSYYLLKFVTESNVITIGKYVDNINASNSFYLICGTDFINLLAEAKKIESADDIRETAFKPLMCIFDRNEMTKELLRD
jgi:uncharacterized protein Veg